MIEVRNLWIHTLYISTGQSVYKCMQITINMHNISKCSLVGQSINDIVSGSLFIYHIMVTGIYTNTTNSLNRTIAATF